MASVSEEIKRIEDAKKDIADAIELCGVDVPETAKLDDYAELIEDIPSAVFGSLDVSSVGGSGKYIESISQSNGKISATAKDLPSGCNKTGTVTSVTITAGTGIAVNDSTAITSSGSRTISLAKATNSTIGGMMASNVLTTAVTLTSSSGNTANRYYGVLIDKDGKAFVNIPWSNSTYNVAYKALTSGFETAYRTQTKGNTNNGWFISTIRSESNLTDCPAYGAGLAFGSQDTHGYLYMHYNTAEAYLGAGNADKLNWTKKLAFADGTGASGTWGISITGNSATSTRLVINDIRGTDHLPNSTNYPEKRITAWFNSTGTPTSELYSGITVKGWTNAYQTWQLASGSAESTNNALFFRRGRQETVNGVAKGVWSDWEKIAFTSDIPTHWADQALGTAASTSTTPTFGANVRLNSSLSGAGGDVCLELWRGSNASWRILNTSGYLKFQYNYTTSKLNTFYDALRLDYGAGHALFSGNAYFGSTNYYFASSGNLKCNNALIGGSFSLKNGTNSYISFYNSSDTNVPCMALIHAISNYNTTTKYYVGGATFYFRIFSAASGDTASTVSTSGYVDYMFPTVARGLTAKQGPYTIYTSANPPDVQLLGSISASDLPLVFAGSVNTSTSTKASKLLYTATNSGYLTYKPSTLQLKCYGGFYQTSDARLKDFKKDVEVDLDKLANLPKKYFTWKDNSNTLHIGTSAQELLKLYPELVSGLEDDSLTVAYDKLSIIALKAIDVLNQKIKDLESKLNQLKLQ